MGVRRSVGSPQEHLRGSCRMFRGPRGAGKGRGGASLRLFILCSRGLLWAPQRDDLGAFSRFCMLLLKASYCISFCLSLPTCKMGPIPPTSLESPGSQHTTWSGRRSVHCCCQVSGSPTLPSPTPLITPSKTPCGGVGLEHSRIL